MTTLVSWAAPLALTIRDLSARGILMAVAVVSVFTAGAQTTPFGVINFSNLGVPDDRRIWTFENGALVRASGTGYAIALYWGPQGTPEQGLVQVGNPASFQLGGGQFSGGTRTVPSLGDYGPVVTVQARAWARIPGVQDSYEAIVAAGLAGDTRASVGKGPVFDHHSNRPDLDPTVGIGNDPLWRGFVIGIPEPSSAILAIFGGGILLILSRAKKCK